MQHVCVPGKALAGWKNPLKKVLLMSLKAVTDMGGENEALLQPFLDNLWDSAPACFNEDGHLGVLLPILSASRLMHFEDHKARQVRVDPGLARLPV